MAMYNQLDVVHLIPTAVSKDTVAANDYITLQYSGKEMRQRVMLGRTAPTDRYLLDFSVWFDNVGLTDNSKLQLAVLVTTPTPPPVETLHNAVYREGTKVWFKGTQLIDPGEASAVHVDIMFKVGEAVDNELTLTPDVQSYINILHSKQYTREQYLTTHKPLLVAVPP
ncbi:ORF078R [Large yellow croaker iridovirus]|nr:ORF078R [Large yellow croaker iridovirus]UZN72156.1 ORF078R [Large yellow croaker iridovirus]UZN72265.1 ORF078R [Large yellow croaker iridovirus]